MDREATRAAIGRLQARTLTYGEIEDALWALAEREGLHDSLPDDPEPEPCGCSVCQLVVPLLHELAGRGGGGRYERAGGGARAAGGLLGRGEDRERREKGPRR